MSTASSPAASATTCRRKLRKPLPRRSSTSAAFDRKQRSSCDWVTSPQVPETQVSFLTTVLSTTGFPEAVKPDDHRDVGCAFRFGEELRRITRRKEASTCQPCRILQTLAPDRRCAGSQHLHFLVACTGRRLKYYRSASECSCTKRGCLRVGVLGISSNVCTVTVQQIWKSWHSLHCWQSRNQ